MITELRLRRTFTTYVVDKDQDHHSVTERGPRCDSLQSLLHIFKIVISEAMSHIKVGYELYMNKSRLDVNMSKIALGQTGKDRVAALFCRLLCPLLCEY